MQYFARWYPFRFRRSAQTSKLSQIRRLLLSGLPPEIILLLIAAIVIPTDIMAALKR